jgi:hypothetical protein
VSDKSFTSVDDMEAALESAGVHCAPFEHGSEGLPGGAVTIQEGFCIVDDNSTSDGVDLSIYTSSNDLIHDAGAFDDNQVTYLRGPDWLAHIKGPSDLIHRAESALGGKAFN